MKHEIGDIVIGAMGKSAKGSNVAKLNLVNVHKYSFTVLRFLTLHKLPALS